MDPELIERTQRFLFASEEEMREAHLTPSCRDRILRIRDMYSYWQRHPATPDKGIVAQLRQQYSIGLTQAYEDVRLLKICLGNLGQVTRQWCQYLFLQRCEEGFAMARASGDANAFAKVLAALGKFTRLDHGEATGPDYSQIVPQQFEMTTDPTVAGFERIPNVQERVKLLLDRFCKEAEHIEPVEVISQEPEQEQEPTPSAYAASYPSY